MKETLTIIIYKGLDWLKQESPFWWVIVQGLIWASFILISTDWINFKGEECVLVLLGGLSSGVGVRTTRKLSKLKVSAESFKEGFKTSTDKLIEGREKIQLSENKVVLKPVEQSTLEIKKQFLPKGQYIDEITFKNQITIHHTAGSSAQSSIQYWLSKPDRIATHFLIDRDGTIIQTIPLECWAYHLGVGMNSNKVKNEYKKNDKKLNQGSISIEICSYGGLTKKPNGYYNTYGGKIEDDRVDILDNTFRGYEYFEKYTKEQIESLQKLLLYLLKEHPHIPIRENYQDIFDINIDALTGKDGIFAHVSYRTDKSDAYPNKDLIQMLNSLSLNPS